MGVTLVQLLPHPFFEMCESPCLPVLRQEWCFFRLCLMYVCTFLWRGFVQSHSFRNVLINNVCRPQDVVMFLNVGLPSRKMLLLTASWY